MVIDKDIIILRAIDVMDMIKTIRGYQQQIAQLQTNLRWVDQTIERLKTPQATLWRRVESRATRGERPLLMKFFY